MSADGANLPGSDAPGPDDPTRTSPPRSTEAPPGHDDPTRTRAPNADVNAGTQPPARNDRLPAPLQFRDPDRYQVIGEHGRGGLGRVLRARDKELGRDVAVKELLERNNTSELRFFREALITARLEHPGIVPVHEAGRWPDGTPFYAMKLVQGRSLRALIDDCKTMEDRLALIPHVIAVADAIAYAHDRKIIHRDLKPSNVIVGDFGETVVIDWGLAKDITDEIPEPTEAETGALRAPAADGLTVAGSVLGTPAYMSPEQREGKADERSDVYALGGILHHVLTGSPPHVERFADSSVPEGGPQAMPRDLVAIAGRATALSAVDRYASAQAFADDLRRFSRREPVSARRYSLAARAALGFARYRTAALILIAALLVVSVTLAVAVLKIGGERAEAIHARNEADVQRASAEKERDSARLAQASMLLHEDPTAAEALLKNVKIGPSEALVLAWARAEGVADRVIPIPGQRVHAAVPDETGGQIAVASSDRSLYIVDTDTGSVQKVATDLLEPPGLVRVDGGWLYSRAAGKGYQIASTRSDTPIWNIPETGTAPILVPDAKAAILDGTLLEFRDGQGIPVATSARLSLRHGDAWITCLLSGNLVSVQDSGGQVSLGRCASEITNFTLSANPAGFVARGKDTVIVGRASMVVPREIRVGQVSRLSLATNGLLAGINDDGSTWIVRPSSLSPEPGLKRPVASPTAVAADGSLAAWGYADGIVDVWDIDTGATWELRGAPSYVVSVLMDARRRRIISVSGPELRVWTLGPPMGMPAQALPCEIFNLEAMQFAGKTMIANDCADGAVVVSELRQGRIVDSRVRQRHASFAFGIAWRTDSEVCSSGWDGAVLCSDLMAGLARAVTRTTHPVRWIAANGNGQIAYVSAEGGVWLSDGIFSHKIFEHGGEPYRAAFNESGDKVASCAYDGVVAVNGANDGRVLFSTRSHRGLITSIHWKNDDTLLSAGIDGLLQQHYSDGRVRNVAQFGGELRHLAESGETTAVAINGSTLWIQSSGHEFKIEPKTEIVSIAISQDGNDLAATTGTGELIALSQLHSGQPAIAVAFLSRLRSTSVVFLNGMIVAASGYGIYVVPQSRLAFVRFRT